MSTITKQWLKQKIAGMEAARDEIPFGLDEGDSNTLAALRIALASLEAEAVAYVDPFSFHNFSVYRAGETDNRRMGREWMWANPDAGLIPVYTAPPAPVSLPDLTALDNLAGEMLNHAMNCERRVAVAYTHCAHRLAEEVRDLRAAMLQGAEPDFREISNSSTKHFRENAETSTKCWCHTCRPVKISDMRFVVCPECGNKRCPHANDHRNACTGSNEPGQQGSAYPAAPQKEVK